MSSSLFIKDKYNKIKEEVIGVLETVLLQLNYEIHALWNCKAIMGVQLHGMNFVFSEIKINNKSQSFLFLLSLITFESRPLLKVWDIVLVQSG